ncbi:MAG TPA: arsenate reductase ArsC [Steroidobacteraceae bacterium]|jgi:protein-tyrosine-phosphatase|nr:arsenate reductase ArsC [Steroidobacteraceae bacterium]
MATEPRGETQNPRADFAKEKAMEGQPFRVLFLSRRNSARSMMAEAIANSIGHGQFEAFSAGVRPATRVDPVAVEVLQHAGLDVPDHLPRHVREFSAPDSPPFDFVVTLSDTPAGEAPPTWPGHPITAHWRCADPEQFHDEGERRLSLARIRAELERRLRVFANLPVNSLDRISLQAQVDALGDSASG